MEQGLPTVRSWPAVPVSHRQKVDPQGTFSFSNVSESSWLTQFRPPITGRTGKRQFLEHASRRTGDWEVLSIPFGPFGLTETSTSADGPFCLSLTSSGNGARRSLVARG